MAHRTSRHWAAAALVGLLGWGTASPTRAEPEKERPTCRHWAVLLPEDAGQHRVYDGIRKGLELAQMERVCLKDVTDDEKSFQDLVAWHATLPKPEPLLFAIGRRAGARLLAAGYAGPGVLMSTEVTVKGEPLAPEPALGPRMARVRAEVAAEVWGAAIRDLLGLPASAVPVVEVPVPALPSDDPRAKSYADALQRFATAAQIRLGGDEAWESWWERNRKYGDDGKERTGPRPEPPPPPVALLHVRVAAPLDVDLPSFDAVRERARAAKVPLLSDDPARFGGGAVLVIVPDHQRVGRTAAEAGRRLWQNEPDALGRPLVVRTTEVWVDLVAAEAIGLEPPLTFLAAADRVRAPPRKAAPTAPAPGAPGPEPTAPAPSAPK